MRRSFACLAGIGLVAISFTACASMVDDIRNAAESGPTIMAEALANQKQALDGGCLAQVFGEQPLRSIMATQANAKEIPPKDSGSPTAIAAWKLNSANTTVVMELPGGACSLAVRLGDPQQLYDAAVVLIQTRAAFTQGRVDTSERGDAQRTSWCTAGLNPYVVVFYKRTTGSRDAFLANVFKAQGAVFSACRVRG